MSLAAQGMVAGLAGHDVRVPWAWSLPVQLWVGSDALGAVCQALGGRHCVVLALEPAQRLGWREAWTTALGPALAGWVSLPEGLATLALARQAAAALWPLLDDAMVSAGQAGGAEPPVLLALGGGSVMDVAKLLRCRPRGGQLAHTGADAGFDALVGALRKRQPWPALAPVPLWLVPTTAATGSEVTRWATLWDTDTDNGNRAVRKLSFDEPFGWADRSFVDASLSFSCPPEVLRDGALDALSHALEAVWNHHANPVSDALALDAAQRILRVLPLALQQPQNPAWRHELSLAALVAGMAFSQTRTALAHALSYAVTLEQGLPHGRACAIWLPLVWRLAMGISPRVDHALSRLFGCPPEEGAVQLEHWLASVGVEPSPQAHGVPNAGRRIVEALASERGRNFIGSMRADGTAEQRPDAQTRAEPSHSNK